MKIEYLFYNVSLFKMMQFDLHVGGRCFKSMDPALLRKHTAESHLFANGMHVAAKRSSEYVPAAVNSGRRVACLIKQHKN